MSALNPLLGFVAGALTILSPCVLPLVPIVLGNAVQAGKWGPWALATGLILSFTGVGLGVAALGASTVIDASSVAMVGAVLLIVAGGFLAIPLLQRWLSAAVAPLVQWANARQGGLERFGLIGQMAIGALLGLVWSPCVGPTLGAATILAAQGRSLASAAAVMFAFALGIATVLLLLSFAARGVLSRWRGRMLAAGHVGKMILGGAMALVGVLVLTGGDHLIEGFLVSVSPEWLTTLTTRI